MKQGLAVKGWINLGLVLLAALYLLVPSFNSDAKQFLFNGQDPIRKGLDLKGGIELLLAPDYRVEDRVLLGIKDDLITKMTSLQMTAPKWDLYGSRDENKYDGLKFTFASANDLQRVINAKAIPEKMDRSNGIEKLAVILKPVGVTADNNGNTAASNTLIIKIQMDPALFGEDALVRAKDIISKRVNGSGIAETDVRLDKSNGRIQVQLPGVSSLDEAEKLLKATGRLNFRLDGKIVMFGSDLQDATARYDTTKGAPVIDFKFGSEGANQFRVITSDNIGKKLAMYLDEDMLMDPVIQSVIPDGSGQISLGSGTSLDQAKEYAILMRSGALPISLRTIQNTQVAPTLGSEMVRQSLIGGIAGIILVILFMLIFYSIPGLIANVALIAYIALVLGVFALFRSVLTLPGVAGFILTIGAAVDANIIIFERIKDELRSGKRLRAAVESGFERAFTAIFDSNVSTLITGIVLLIFSTGPVKGFAVTLLIGTLVSLYTAIQVSRTLLEMMIDKDPDKYAKYFGA